MKWIRGISFKLFIICLFFIWSSVIVISVLFYNFVKEDIQQKEIQHNKQILQKVQQFLEMYFLMVENTHITVLSTIKLSIGDREVLQNQLSQLYDANSSFIRNIYIIKNDYSIIGGNLLSKIFDEPTPERKMLFEQAMADPQVIKASEPYFSSYSGRTITVTRRIPFLNDYAVLALDMDLGALEDYLLRIGDYNDYKIGIMHASGKSVAQSLSLNGIVSEREGKYWIGNMDFQSIYTEGNDYISIGSGSSQLTMIKSLMPRLGWVVYSVLDETLLAKSVKQLQVYFIGLSVIGFMLSLATSLFVSRFIRKPVYYLIRKMGEIRNGNLNIVISGKRQDEFGELAKNFDDMLGRIRLLIRDLNESEKLKRELEIQVLQSQINPHFLYNTLGSISNVVALGRYGEVDKIVGALISILEYGIADFSDKVTLQEELDNVRNYVYIQNIRYGNTIRILENIDPGLMQVPVLRMILQPIVENSIFHGHNGGVVDGTIGFSAYRIESRMRIEITDNGVGMSEKQISKVLSTTTRSDQPNRRKRIGLNNIHKRIRLYYGEEYGLEIRSAPGQGTSVSLQFPVQESEVV